ncbi:uncharacterized protein BO96DRAFT_8833 [Aspergillus niger CBS 101883]|uniref:uncharacterized protein n=1 Tax=Aspergillus lacticoffeatus (strain CBS 101883) TaxID=1450533 RepID=UPI000D7ED28D|nr:uncharacterized protein BO96DRAFT_8833 [Aspergillus niger CBS 101883]PYH62169.1 hypothetical protein BO96DRAFT_8833 [Aspergillus niger CBS 101883]
MTGDSIGNSDGDLTPDTISLGEIAGVRESHRLPNVSQSYKKLSIQRATCLSYSESASPNDNLSNKQQQQQNKEHTELLPSESPPTASTKPNLKNRVNHKVKSPRLGRYPTVPNPANRIHFKKAPIRVKE